MTQVPDSIDERNKEQSTPEDPDIDRYISLLLAEFSVIRQEIAQTQTQMLNAHRWGVSFAAATTAGAVYEMNTEPHIFSLLTIVATPMICLAAMLLIIGEADRFKRAADYIYLIEGKTSFLVSQFVRKKFRRNWISRKKDMEATLRIRPYSLRFPMEWEHWLRYPDRRSVSRVLHIVRFMSLALVMLGSQILFYYKIYFGGGIREKYIGEIDIVYVHLISSVFWVSVLSSLLVGARIAKGVVQR